VTYQAFPRFALLLTSFGLLVGCGADSAGAPSDAWVGKTFLLDTPSYPAVYWVKPKGFGADIGTYVPRFLIGVEKGAATDELTISLAAALGGTQDLVQDLCVPTTQVTASGANYPLIDIVADAFPMRIYDTNADSYVPTTGRNVLFRNLLPGNTDTSIAEFDATIDVSELYSLFYQVINPSKDSVCATFASYQVPCETCASNDQPYCLTIRGVQMSATESPVPIQIVTTPSCS
jgi:hypothetical protein